MATDAEICDATVLVATFINACNLTRPDQVYGAIIVIRSVVAYTERTR